jgi:hypothetical protein
MGSGINTPPKSFKALSRKKLVSLVRDDMGYSDDDFDFKNITKGELLEIVDNHFGGDYNKGGMTKMNKGMKALKKKAPAVAKKMGYSYGGSVKKPMKMNRGGMCGASNPASRPMKSK